MAYEDRTSRTVGQLTFLGHILFILKLLNCSSRLKSICQFHRPDCLYIHIILLCYY